MIEKSEGDRVRNKLAPHFAKDGFCGYFAPRGWARIIEGCHDELMLVVPNYRIDQVKEKFGTLRFYFSTGEVPSQQTWEQCSKIVSKYEKMSETTCEVCGELGELRDGYWVRTLCDKHEGERNKTKEK